MEHRDAEVPAGRVRPVQVEELRDDVRAGQDDDLLALRLLNGRDQGVDRPVVRDATLGELAEIAQPLHAASAAALRLGVDRLLRFREVLPLTRETRTVEVRRT